MRHLPKQPSGLNGRAACLALGCWLLVGCGSKYDLVPVSGRVTLGGQPVEQIVVTTQPRGTKGNSRPGPGSFGHTDADGHFTLELQTEERAGAVVGEHIIRLVDKRSEKASNDDTYNPRTDQDRLPDRAQDGSIRLMVPKGGTDQMNIDL
ncbi:MAG: hypothetical protein MK171_00285 [Pirellulales bacterium]|nr:hypothetical protein [Pirellulales bacterium]